MADPNDHYYESGKIYWRVPTPTNYFVDSRGGGRQISWGQEQEEEPKAKKRGILGIFTRLKTQPSDPGYEIAKRIIHGVGEQQIRRAAWEQTQPISGPQLPSGPLDYHVDVPQLFDAPRGGFYDEIGRWHDR